MTENDEVIFVSHQWTSFSHPDPAGNQLRALQTQIRTLMKGKTAVRSDAALDGGYGYAMNTPGKEWKKSSRTCTSGSTTAPSRSRPPQARRACGAALGPPRRPGGPRRAAQASRKQHPLVSRAIDDDVGARAAGQARIARRSHLRLQLVAPARLVPPRVRRVKLCAGDDMPCMVITSATATPEYCCPCDIFKLCAGNGDFTVDSDRDAVNSTLTKMLEAKVEGYANKGGHHAVADDAGHVARVRAAARLRLGRGGLRRRLGGRPPQKVHEVAQRRRRGKMG